jgi:hypothetical protein
MRDRTLRKIESAAVQAALSLLALIVTLFAAGLAMLAVELLREVTW